MNKGLRVLVSAYACHPLAAEESNPGEAILGWNLVKQLARRYSLEVLTRPLNRSAIEKAMAGEKIGPVKFHYISLPKYFDIILRTYLGFRLYYFFWQYAAFLYARRIARRQRFDVFHQITFNNDWMPSFIGAYLPLPFIWGPVGGGQRVPPPLFGALHRQARWQEIKRDLGQWFWRNNYFRRRAARRAAAILVCNKDTWRKVIYLNPKVYDFPVNGISINEYRSRRKNKKNGKRPYRVLFAGRLDPIKGIPLGLRAFGLFSAKFPGSRFEIIGVGGEEARLKRLVSDLDLEEKVVFTPWIDRKVLLRKMGEADVFLFPSFRDGGGAVVVEAMASGLPVVCLNTGGPGFHIQKEWGIKVDPAAPDEVVDKMAQALEILNRQPKLRIQLGRRARIRAADYLWDELGLRLFRIYDQALNMPADRS